MFGIGSMEVLVILVVALLVLGPQNLPKVARSVGRAMGEFRKVSTEFQRTLNTEAALAEQEEKRRAENLTVSGNSVPETGATQSPETPPGDSKTGTA